MFWEAFEYYGLLTGGSNESILRTRTFLLPRFIFIVNASVQADKYLSIWDQVFAIFAHVIEIELCYLPSEFASQNEILDLLILLQSFRLKFYSFANQKVLVILFLDATLSVIQLKFFLFENTHPTLDNCVEEECFILALSEEHRIRWQKIKFQDLLHRVLFLFRLKIDSVRETEI